MSVHYAGQVIRKSLLLSPGAGRMGVPTIPLSELYSRAIDYIGEPRRPSGSELRSGVFQWFEETQQWTITTHGRELHQRRHGSGAGV